MLHPSICPIYLSLLLYNILFCSHSLTNVHFIQSLSDIQWVLVFFVWAKTGMLRDYSLLCPQGLFPQNSGWPFGMLGNKSRSKSHTSYTISLAIFELFVTFFYYENIPIIIFVFSIEGKSLCLSMCGRLLPAWCSWVFPSHSGELCHPTDCTQLLHALQIFALHPKTKTDMYWISLTLVYVPRKGLDMLWDIHVFNSTG